MSISSPDGSLRELARRSSDSLEVALFWDCMTNLLTVCVGDDRRGLYFELYPEPGQALDCFYHPYFYASAGAEETSPVAA
jgi:hypothetical protein